MSSDPELLHISPAEWDVIREVTRDGAPNALIAERLGCNEERIKYLMRRLITRTHYKNRTELIVALAKNELRLIVVEPERLKQRKGASA